MEAKISSAVFAIALASDFLPEDLLLYVFISHITVTPFSMQSDVRLPGMTRLSASTSVTAGNFAGTSTNSPVT